MRPVRSRTAASAACTGNGWTTAVAAEVDPALEVAAEDARRVVTPDAPEEQALGEDDEVAGEAVAADVARLPHPSVGCEPAEIAAELLAVLRAAAVADAVSADEQERMPDRVARALAAAEHRNEVQLAEPAVRVELEAAEAARVVP